jgi:hypothetical protein
MTATERSENPNAIALLSGGVFFGAIEPLNVLAASMYKVSASNHMARELPA